MAKEVNGAYSNFTLRLDLKTINELENISKDDSRTKAGEIRSLIHNRYAVLQEEIKRKEG